MNMAEKKRSFFSEYNIGRTLGDGNFAIVYEAIRKKDSQKFAVKMVKKYSLQKKDLDNLSREITVLTKLDHPSIVKMVEVFDEWDKCYLVMELMTGGELFDRIVEKAHYSEAEAKEVVLTVVKALKYLHSHGIAHRDLKPENLLYTDPSEAATIKLADFGFAKDATITGSAMSTMCGTPGYFAPEVISKGVYGPECDIWSLGVITYILLCGFPPFYDENQIAEMEKIRKGEFDFPSPYFDQVSDEAKDLITKMLTVNVTRRLTADGVLSHPWIADVAAGHAPDPSSLPTLSHVGANLSGNKAKIRAAFRANVKALMLIHYMSKPTSSEEAPIAEGTEES